MSITRTMTLAKAQSLAADTDLPTELADLLRQALAQALSEGWDVLDFTLDGDNITVAPHTGVMVAWMLPEYTASQLRIEGGEQDLHVTLAFLGDISDLTVEQQRAIVGVVAEVLEDEEPLYGYISGTGTFPASDGVYPWFAEVTIRGLAELRERVVTALVQAGLPVDTTYPDYHPHITLAYLEDGTEPPALELPPVIVNVDELTVALAGARRTLSMRWKAREDGQPYQWEEKEAWLQEQLGDNYWETQNTSAYRPLVKSVVEAEKRFTLGPWYIPGSVDAHDEWTDADNLQAALWGYVDSGYRSIHLQHSPDIVAGRWVELMTLPWPMTVPIIDPNGNVVAHQYPAGTVMMGVIWLEWAWELVKAGKITGYSIGGNAIRIEEDAPEATDQLDDGRDPEGL